MKIYFRASEKEFPITFPRLEIGNNRLKKKEIIKKCWLSLQSSISNEDELIVVHDEVSQETLDFLDKTARSLIRFHQVPKHKWEHHAHTVELFYLLEKEMNNYNDSDWIYLLEDDYLHTKDALTVIRESQKYWGGFITPYELPGYYLENIYSKVFVGETRHWKTVHKSTMTICARVSTIKEHMDLFKNMAPKSNDRVFETIYKDTPCICPLPGVTSHLADDQMSPLVPWIKIWNEIKI